MIVAADSATVKQRRWALLLYLAGPDVQDIFATLPDTGEVTDYKKAVDALNLYFIEIAEKCEKVNSQMAAMSSTKQDGTEIVNYMKEKKGNRRDKKPQVNHDKTCYRCSKPEHFAKDSSCPARGKVCRKCGLKDNFETQCKTRPKQEKRGNHQSQRHHQHRNTANFVSAGEEDPVYAFIIGSTESERIGVTVGGCQLNMIVDSGASVNIVGKQTWE